MLRPWSISMPDPCGVTWAPYEWAQSCALCFWCFNLIIQRPKRIQYLQGKIWEPKYEELSYLNKNYLICWLKSRKSQITNFLSNHCLQHQGRKYVYKPWDRDNSLSFSSSRPVTNYWASWLFLSLLSSSAHLFSAAINLQQSRCPAFSLSHVPTR